MEDVLCLILLNCKHFNSSRLFMLTLFFQKSLVVSAGLVTNYRRMQATKRFLAQQHDLEAQHGKQPITIIAKPGEVSVLFGIRALEAGVRVPGIYYSQPATLTSQTTSTNSKKGLFESLKAFSMNQSLSSFDGSTSDGLTYTPLAVPRPAYLTGASHSRFSDPGPSTGSLRPHDKTTHVPSRLSQQYYGDTIVKDKDPRDRVHSAKHLSLPPMHSQEDLLTYYRRFVEHSKSEQKVDLFAASRQGSPAPVSPLGARTDTDCGQMSSRGSLRFIEPSNKARSIFTPPALIMGLPGGGHIYYTPRARTASEAGIEGRSSPRYQMDLI
jgi:hypothetical protein